MIKVFTWGLQTGPSDSWLEAYSGGVVSSVLPCILSLLPLVVGYMGAFGLLERRAMTRQLIVLVTGIALVLTSLGVLAAINGLAYGALIHREWYLVMGLAILVLGIMIFKDFAFAKYDRPGLSYASAWIAGLFFGSVSIPCGTPYLAQILGSIHTSKDILPGGAMLFCYTFGQCMILIAAGLAAGWMHRIAVAQGTGGMLRKMSAGLFLITAVMLLAQGTNVLNGFLRAVHLL